MSRNIIETLKKQIYNIIIFVLLLVFIWFSFSIITNNELNRAEKLKDMQLLAIPITVLGAISGMMNNNKNRHRQLELEKIRMTNQFVKDFRSVMNNFTAAQLLKHRYYEQVEHLKELQDNLEKSERHYFDLDYFAEINTTSASYEDINKLIRITEDFDFKKGNSTLNKYVETCIQYQYNENYNSKSDIMEIIEKFNEKIEELENSKLPEGKVLKPKEHLERKIEFEEHKTININKEKLIFSRAMRNIDTELLNDMECLLLNVNFDLLNYKQIYYLVYAPFTAYIDVFYFDILFTYLNGKERGLELFSNIRMFYDELYEYHIKEKVVSKEEIVSKRNKEREKQHKKKNKIK